ncbi:VWA domain-containing protein [Pseudomonas knackmussii]|uniref:VWA domain-containing protein n=1 Tax=Pseudomonas knackmussii TaxID=65741 RepID=A0ABY4KRD4_9PSED|nr:VWA domain-containing protein [Pseudomonas knackmussii]UPQ83431.1 VWA domain-containing protein [Pseudomonas knackmussii]
MAEAEDVISDVARHATIYIQRLWQRRRSASGTPTPIVLEEVTERLDLLIHAAFGCSYPLRIAQPPAPPTLLAKLFRRVERPYRQAPVPATDGVHIWLPVQLGIEDYPQALQRYRGLALQQAMRAQRGSAALLDTLNTPLQRNLYLLLEAWAADIQLLERLPGIADTLNALRQHALNARPALNLFSPSRQPLERLLRQILQRPYGEPVDGLLPPATPTDALAQARQLAAKLMAGQPSAHLGEQPLLLDLWTGELRPSPITRAQASDAAGEPESSPAQPHSARLPRRPEAREALEGEDEEQAEGIWMVQPSPPLEQAEDPMGMQRPTDRDDATPAEEYADSLSELNEARLVLAPGSPKEVLLSDDPPDARTLQSSREPDSQEARLSYPEWDYKSGSYRNPGAIVHLLPTALGPQQWVTQTLETHRSMLDAIRRQFEMLRAHRLRLRRQLDGDELDLDAYIDGLGEARAGLDMPQAVYQLQRTARRDMAIVLLVDASGSTDGWLSSNRRIIDIEREALLLVCMALEGLGEPYSVQTFSGEGPGMVTLRNIKAFDERYNDEIGQRIAGLEPERYTRAGAAIRHASSLLMGEPAAHRLLLLLSDGKPNDVDEYEGRYGVEDMRQAVNEAKLQGIYPFCLTIDRQAANYLPKVFGPQQYALLPKPELLPSVLLEWLKRLIAT